MNKLLERVIDAHGGLAQWRQFSDFVADVHLDGTLCSRNGMAAFARDTRLILSLRDDRTIALLPDSQGRMRIQAHSISLFDSAGAQLRGPSEPERVLRNEQPNEWSWMLRTAYLMGYVIRQAVMAPFLYSSPGFSVEEVEPWDEDGVRWRVLKITFPSTSHTSFRVQHAYYDNDGFLKRTRNVSPLFGEAEVAHYVTGYGRVDGIWIPTSREVFTCDDAGKRIEETALATIGFQAPFFTD